MGLEHEIKTMDHEKNGLHVLSEEELVLVQKKLTETLVAFKNICDQCGIKWALVGGSLLGAVRHKGFIPWDDDIDVAMTRTDYNKLLAFFQQYDDPKYSLHYPGEKGYYCHVPRFYSNETKLRIIQSSGKDSGLYVDIFVLDDIPDSRFKRLIHGITSTFYLLIISCVVTNTQKENFMKYGSERLINKVKFRVFLSKFFSFKPVEWWLSKGTAWFSKYHDPDSRDVVSATGSGHYFHEIYSREVLCNYAEGDFEGRKFPIPMKYDAFLSQLYGNNYMQIPPVEKRERHAVIEIDLGKD